ncbi:MAG: sigma 54-interacting transcriptional regulator, partial [Oscillospiraceae bacterium]
MQKKILFLIPRDSMSDSERSYYKSLYPEVEFASADPYNPMQIAKEKLREGVEIIAGRGNTAVAIRHGMPDIHVVEIPITGYDIIHSLGHTDFKGKTIAVITNNADIIGINLFEQLYGVRILSYMMVPFGQLSETIRDAVAHGAEYVVGGAITCKAARELGVPARMICLGRESMARAIHEIRQVQEAIEIEAQRQGFINRLIDNIAEGVISLDLENRITLVNANAERALGLFREQVIGQPIREALAGVSLDAALLESADEAGRLIEVGGNQMMATRIPIMNKEKNYGIIYTLHESNRIALMEHSIRKAAYDGKSHLARYQFSDLIGESDVMRETVRAGRSYAQTDASILIAGETGTGKELFAQSIHNASPRCKGAFVAVNCASLPSTLLESELFGYVEGAFTGANRKGKAGLFETAHGGSIFL